MPPKQSRPANPYYDGPRSDHFNGRRFFNPGGIHPLGLRAALKWQIGGRGAKWPKSWPSPFAGAKPVQRVEDGGLRITMIGHASLLIQVAGVNILTDPVWSNRVSPVSFIGPKRRNEPGVALEDLPPIDLVLVTHNHYDHLDIATLKVLHRAHTPGIITPLGNDRIIREAVPDAAITTTDWGEQTRLENGITVYTEPCHHWSARGSRDQRMALWAAFVIATPAGKIYHIGDTGFHDGINYCAARQKHGEFRLANLPIGAYEPQWFMKPQHQNPSEAVEGMRISNAAYAIGHHWGTFKLTNEAIEDPIRALEVALEAAGVSSERFRTLRPGESFDVPMA